MLLAIFCWLSVPVAALRCYTVSYDVKNWPRCSDYAFGMSQWQDRCMYASDFPVCESLRVSQGCPVEGPGLLPCQFDWKGAFGDPPEGTKFQVPDLTESTLPYNHLLKGGDLCSHDYNGLAGNVQDFNVCAQNVERCQKTVTENYKAGVITHWTVSKGCGNCPWKKSVTSACEDGVCLDLGDQSCACSPKSADVLITRTCHECIGDMCNQATRRAIHHVTAVFFCSLFLSLLVRKCSA